MNGLICINKPENMTSFDVVRIVRNKLQVKVGHNGTLDPMATGVLILAINNATKSLPYINIDDKTYIATLKLGIKTHTGDIWGDTLEEKEPTQSFLDIDTQALLNTFIGTQTQKVPKVSAKKINGKKSYEYVRNNQEVMDLFTDIEIYDIKELNKTFDTLTFEAKVSKGTYIRTLCEDIAEKIGEIGTMSVLERTQVGNFTLDDCLKIEEINPDIQLINTKERISLPTIKDTALNEDVLHGKRIKLDCDEPLILIDGGEHYAVYKKEKESIYKSVRGLW